MIHLFVKGQVLQVDAPTIVAGSIDYLSARFCFQSSDWDGMQKWAHFSCGDTVYDIELTDDRIEKDKHLNLSAGEWKIWLHGSEYVDGELVERITTNEKYITVLPTGATDTDNPFPSAEPSVVEQIYADLDNTVQAAVNNAIPDAVDAALKTAKESGEFDGKDGIDGAPGADGKSAYQIALDNGFEGTEAEWLESLKGEDGEPGAPGQPGEDGRTPVKGEDYFTDADKAELVEGVLEEVGGKQVQGDWAQNNPTQPDHILNRTHWVEPGGVTEILPETSLTYSEDMGGFVLVNALPLEVGAEYTVSWNGAEFVCVGQTFSEGELTGVVLGNIGLMAGGADTGEPFIILTLPPEAAAEMGIGTQIMPIDGSTEVTISIIGGKGDVYHKLDNNFLDLAWLPTIDVVENEVVPETTVTIGSALQLYSTDIAYSMIPEGTGTVVTWNGAKYNCTVKTVKVDGLGVYFYLGNIGMVSAELGANTGEPFVFAVMDINGKYGIAVSSSGDHVYSISTLDKVYNTIPEEFLGVDTSDVLEIDLYEMGMAEVVASSTVGYSFDTAEVLYALQTGKKVTVSFRLRINHVSGGVTTTPHPKITLTGSGSGRLTTGYGTSIEELNYGVEAATFISVYLDNNGVRVTAYRLADLIDARIATAFTDGDEVSY